VTTRELMREAGWLGVEIRRRGEVLELAGPPDVVEAVRPDLDAAKDEILAFVDERDNGHPYVALLTFDECSPHYAVCL